MYEPLRVATQPLTFVLCLLVLATLAAARRAARPAWRRLALGLALLASAVSHPYVAWITARSLERQYPPPAIPVGSLHTLVVLSGGLLAGEAGEGALAEDSLARTVCAARFARQTHPDVIVVTGGVVSPATPVSAARRMKDLLDELGAAGARVLVEGRAMTTVGNARESKAMLSPAERHRVGLVTDALHMPRAIGVFRAEGFGVVPLPCQRETGPRFQWSASTLLPGPRAARLFNSAAHEWIAMVYSRLAGAWR